MIHKQSIVKRAGITITEALASIAIAATGLFAVLAIIPFAARQTEAGLELDVAVSVGKNAVHDFDVRGMGRVSNWRIAYVPSTDSFNVRPASSYWAGKAVVIDPLFINQNINSPDLDPTDRTNLVTFPYPAGAIDRINLSSNGTAYNFAHSEGIFRSVNELVFNAPANDLDFPNQSLAREGVVDLKRNYQGKISWMAMVVPETDVVDEVNPHMYRLYVIVFNDRTLRYRPNASGIVPGEVVYSITAAGSMIGGGTFDFQNPTGLLAQDDYLNNGDWVLLTDSPGSNWRWYQIQRTDFPSKQDQNKQFTDGLSVAVTLQGADWTGTPPTFAIVLSNVISVYEKTIRIEYDSIWNE